MRLAVFSIFIAPGSKTLYDALDIFNSESWTGPEYELCRVIYPSPAQKNNRLFFYIFIRLVRLIPKFRF
jgi:hypothetical protein